MINWFEIFAEKLAAIEEGQKELRNLLTQKATTDPEPNGDFQWLESLFPGIPKSTLRQWDAAGKIPGTSKFGKRKIYHKATILQWLRNQTHQPAPSSAELAQTADEQISRQLAKGRCVQA